MNRDQSYAGVKGSPGAAKIAIEAYADLLDDPEAALDGRACLFCGGTAGAMKPVGVYEGCQIFGHTEEGDCHA